jgi:Flp pilus assembly pilin Flp
MKLRDWIEFVRIQLHREEGQTMAEYGVVLAVITVAVVGAITALALAISGKLGNVTGILNTKSQVPPCWDPRSCRGSQLLPPSPFTPYR